MKVKTLEVEYQAGDFSLVQGISKGTPDSYGSRGHFQSRGHGWGQVTAKSDLVLTAETDLPGEEIIIIKVGDYFKAAWGRLTQERQVAIINTLPAELEVSWEKNDFGEIQYEVQLADLRVWLEVAKADALRAKKSRQSLKRK